MWKDGVFLMQKITIISVGKLKEDFFIKAVAEYQKRLSRDVKLNFIEIPQAKLPENPGDKEIFMALKKEEEAILKHLKNEFIVALCIEGKQYKSEEFAEILSANNPITFIIGSSHGLSDKVKEKANIKLSFSKMTFAHRLFKVMLLEQIYRGVSILKGTHYHK